MQMYQKNPPTGLLRFQSKLILSVVLPTCEAGEVAVFD